jgi:ATP-dependent Clp protease protease subunit
MQEHRSLSRHRVELREAGGKPLISGYAAIFDSPSVDLGGYTEIIRRGAFDASLKEIRDGKRDVAARIQHEGGLTTVARVKNGSLRLEVDARGLRYEFSPPDTSAGRDLLTLVRDGLIDQSSFAFSLRDKGEKWDTRKSPPLRELLNVNIHDVAPVDGPAYEATSVQARSAALASLEKAKMNIPDYESRAAGSRIEKRAVEGGSAVDIYFLDEIIPTWMARYMTDAMGAGDVVDALKDAPDAKTINVYINSPGGDVFEAATIFNTLKQHPAPVNVYIQGLAASAASYIAMAGDTIQMGEGTFMMIHNAWTVAIGNAQDMRAQAAFLDKIDGEIAGIYTRRTGQDLAQVKKWMRDETWMSAEDAVNLRFADKASAVVETSITEADGERCRKMNFRNIPAALGGRGRIELRSNPSLEDWKAVLEAEMKAAV